MRSLGFIPLEQKVRRCRTETRNCSGMVHTFIVHPTRDAEPHTEELCAWHGQCWPRADPTRKADEDRRKQRMRNAIQEGQGFGQMAKLGRGRREVKSET